MRFHLKGYTLALATFAAACGAFSATGQEAVIAMNISEVGMPTLNPTKSANLGVVGSLIYDCLVVQDKNYGFKPLLAESWQEASDSLSWVFHLKKGVTFHNSEPFDAETIPKWIGFFKGTENEYMAEAIDKVELIDKYTVKFVLSRPEPNLLYNLAQRPMGIPEPKAYERLGDQFGVTQAIGTGPFKLESFEIGAQTALVRNDAYRWGATDLGPAGPAKVERLTFREISEDSTAFLELKTGGVDMLMSVPPDLIGEMKAEPKISLLTLPGKEVFYMPINVAQEPFTDIRVRKAAAYAVNQTEILQKLFNGVGTVAETMLISLLPESNVADRYKIRYDPAKANEMLDEAGWTRQASGVRAKNGKPLKVSLWTQSDTIFRRLTEVIQAQLKTVGFDPDIAAFDNSSIRDQYKSGKQMLAVRSYFWDNADILDWFFGGYRLGYPNISMFNDPKAEALRVKAMTGSVTQKDRVANFIAYHEYVLEQFPFAPIYQPVRTIGYNNKRLRLPPKVEASEFDAASFLELAVN